MLLAVLTSIALFMQPAPAQDDDDDWGMEAYQKSAPTTATPLPPPAASPPAKAPQGPLILKSGEGWDAPFSEDETDAARFAPTLPKPVEGNCRTSEGSFSCGDSEAARKLAEDLAKGGQRPD